MLANMDVATVQRALQKPLPGIEAQTRMSTRPRTSAHEFNHSSPPRQAAVLVLLYPHTEQLWLPLTRRTERVATHKGQISLPGGAKEAADSSLWQTALREAKEEVGLENLQSVEYLGALSHLYIAPSNFQIHPFVAFTPVQPHFVTDPTEVAELIEFPLAALLDPTTKREETWFWRGRHMQVPFYAWNEHVIWGATAMVLSELEVLLAGELAGRADSAR